MFRSQETSLQVGGISTALALAVHRQRIAATPARYFHCPIPREVFGGFAPREDSPAAVDQIHTGR
jgi:hypothetical protein